ncbi:AraC family transcriptional regulator [Klebsiella quasipneumoniae]|nr:AraC family transcriptional regulator [Klebsiella quasipneumoniae]
MNEVSEKCGFTDTNYFCKVFRDINDCTPLEYRRKIKEQDHDHSCNKR